jgi:NADH-quinone oxidoreductase subunit F
VYERDLDGYQVARRVLTTMTREQVVDEAKKANIRGRGGAGFPMGVKWSFMPKVHGPKPHYLVVNADEGEPGTHKDRTLMEQNPHAASRGASSAATASARTSRTSTCATSFTSPRRASRAPSPRRAQRATSARRPFGKDYPVEVYVHSGAGAYICGEETSMLNSLEGRAASRG